MRSTSSPSSPSPSLRTEAARWTAALAVALGLHAAIGTAGALLRAQPQSLAPKRVAAKVVRVEPPAPEPPPAPAKPEPKPKPAAPPAKAVQEVVDLTKAPSPSDAPPPTDAGPSDAEPAAPVFGLSAQSFGSAGAGFAARRGNTVGVAPGEATSANPAPLKPVPSYSVTAMPQILREPAPNYPPSLRGAGVEGDVIVELVVATDGTATEVRVVESSHPEFGEAALTAVEQVRFEPARQGRTAVPVRIRLPVRFRLR